MKRVISTHVIKILDAEDPTRNEMRIVEEQDYSQCVSDCILDGVIEDTNDSIVNFLLE
jgi:hypothetical protein